MKLPLSAYFAEIDWRGSSDRDGVDRWNRKLRATFMLEVLKDPPDRVSAFFGVCRATIYLWRKEVLASDRAEVEGLRRLIDDMES